MVAARNFARQRKALRPDRPKTLLRGRGRQREKVRRGWCGKNLHRLIGDNVVLYRDGSRRCKACKFAREMAARKEGAARFGLRRIKCAVIGCRADTRRYGASEPYVCRRHRMLMGSAA